MSFARLLEILEIPEIPELLQLLQILHGLSVAPDSLQIVEQTVLLGEHVDDDVAVVHQDPVGGLVALDLLHIAACLVELFLHVVHHGLHLVGVASAADDEVVCQHRYVLDIDDPDILPLFVLQRLHGDSGHLF